MLTTFLMNRLKLEQILGPATMVIRSLGTWIDPDEWRLAQPAMIG